jgi:hypothetical protein
LRKRARLLPVVLALLVLAASVVARFATTNARADVIAVLQGSVGPDFVISLKNPDGSIVGHLDGGPYEIQVNDQASNHNYHLEGPGVSMATGIPDIQTADWMVNFTDGVYAYHCDMHAGLTASFAVGTATIAPPPPAPAPAVFAPAPAVLSVPPVSISSKSSSSSVKAAPVVSSVGGTVKATLTGTKITLTLNGKPLTNAAAGTYKLVVTDRSKSLDLSLVQTKGGINEQPLTSITFTGTKTVTVDLLAGRWKVYSTAGKGVFANFTVTQ